VVTPPDYPFTGRHFDRGGGVRMHYLDEGSGPPVVMLHGNPSWSYLYRRLVLALRDTHRCVVPDHVGMGWSDKPQPPAYHYTLRERVDDISAFLDHAVPEGPLTLVVHDWGGMIGMAWAVRHPERVARLVVLNTGAFPLPAEKPLPWALWLARDTAVGAWLVQGLNAFAVGACHTCVTRRRMPADVRRAFCAPYDSWANRVATLKFVQTIPLRPTDPGYDIVTATDAGLAQFRDTPTLVCWGMRDYVFDRHFLAGWERRLPHAEVHRFPDCGHYILEDAPDEVTNLVGEFLARHPAAGARPQPVTA
jgi:pimeloyl-ACP methyl ester carboxylesterase